MTDSIWQDCLEGLEREVEPGQFETYIKPLHSANKNGRHFLLAPNVYVEKKVRDAYLSQISEFFESRGQEINLSVGTNLSATQIRAKQPRKTRVLEEAQPSSLSRDFTFESFVEGKSNELARAAATQVADNAGRSYNPLLLYGGVGLGKTHLMHAVGNALLQKSPNANILYLHSQRFVQNMVKALQSGTMDQFMKLYRNVDALLIDDIQFFAKKMRSQEEFFHVFNALLEGGHQMVMSSDKYPREIEGLEERLKSRFVWGLTVEIEPPELETRVAILLKKAEAERVELDTPVAFFIAERIRSVSYTHLPLPTKRIV